MVKRVAACDATVNACRTGKTRLKKIELYFRSSAHAAGYLQMFNVASGSVTPGSTVPDLVIPVPAGQTSIQTKISIPFGSNRGGLYFGTALSFCFTTTATGGTSPVLTADKPEAKVHFVEA